ncbi:MAG: hypothetical protein WCI46_15535 [Verrucomicrobiota bacterium]
MPSRNELNLRAFAMGFDPTSIANDSKLEQKVLWLEKNQTAAAVTATSPTTTLTSSGTFTTADTITIGGITYTMRTALTTPQAANEVLIGAAATNSLDNIKDAVNGTVVSGAVGTIYSSPTKRNPLVTAGVKTATTLVFTTTDTNVGGSTATTKSAANFAFTGATMSAGTLGAVLVTNTNSGNRDILAGVSGDANVSL